MHATIGLGLLVTAIAFAFGTRTAQAFVGAVLLMCAAAAAYVAVLVVMDAI